MAVEGLPPPTVTPATHIAGSPPIGREKQSVGRWVRRRALLKALSHKELGAALTLHRISRLDKKGHQKTPHPSSPVNGVHFLRTYTNWTEAEPRSFLVRKGFYLNGGQLALRSSPPISLSVSA